MSGVVDAWEGECPVEGVCSECGFRFRWRDVVGPLRDVPRWFFELAPLRRVWAFPSTCVRTLAPWRFWRGVKLTHPVRAWRLAMFVVFAVLGVWLFLAGVMLAVQGRSGGFGTMTVVSGRRAWVNFAWPTFFDVLGVILGWPFETSEDAWQLGGVPQAVWISVLFLAVTPIGFVCLGRTLGRAKVRVRHVIRAAVYSAVGGMLFLCTLETIRWAGYLYGATNMWGRRSSIGVFLSSVGAWLMWNHWVLVGLLIPWTVLTWWAVCRRYFQIDHGVWVALAMTVIGCLLALLLTITFTHALTVFLSDFV